MVTYVGEAHAADPEVTGDGDVAVTPHANTQEDDLLLAWVSLDSASSTTIDTPSGWTVLHNPVDAATSSRSALFWKLAGASEGATTFTTSSDHVNATVVTFRGVDVADPIDVSASGLVASGATRALPDITTTVDGCALVGFIQIDAEAELGGDQFTAPSGWTTAVDWIETTTFTTDSVAYLLDAGTAGLETGHAFGSVDTTRNAAVAIVALVPGETANAGSTTGSHTWAGSASGTNRLPAPTGLTVTTVSASQLDLDWDAVSGASGYDIERDGTIIVYGHGSTSYSDTGLAAGTTYDYRVRAVP